MGAEGVAPPEGERNPAEGGCFVSNLDNQLNTVSLPHTYK